MRWTQFNEGVGRITKQNQTVDVGPNEISIQAAKFGNKVDKDGRPANMKKKVKGSKTNVLFNLGMTESVDNLYESVLYYRQMKENLGEIAQATEIYVDMDGVLADFFGEWAKLMKVDHFSKIDKEHKIGDALQAIRDKDEFWLNLPLLPQAKQLLSVIKQIKGEYNICSSPLADDPNSEPHKREWIKKNLAFFPPKEVIITHNKPEYATQQDGTPNILIDDYGVNVDAWEAAGGTAFKYKDHKFERTANAIKQHMQEPVAEDKETNKKTQDAATQKAKPYDMPIRKDIADLIIQSYPEIEKIWVTSDQYGIVGTKLKNGPTVLKLQRQLKKDGYPITVDGKAGKDTDKMLKHWLGNVIYYIKHDYLGESITENISESYFDPTKYSKKELDAMQKRSRERYREIQRQEIIRDMEKYYKDLPKDNGLEMDQEDFEKRLKNFKKDNPDLPFAVTSVDENFADGKEKVQEAFDNPYPITWEYLKPTGASSAIGKVDDGSALDIHISEDPAGIYEIEFARGQSNKNMGRTGQGDEFRIFATVQAAMLKWWSQLDKTSARKITFYANKEDGNRSRLYKRFLKMWGDKSEWDIEVNANVKPGLVAYTLTNPTPDEPENAAKTLLQRLFGKKKTVENFADGKKKGKSRPGRVKRSGASCNGSVTELRKKAKKASGERAKMYHWCANMKSGRS